MPAKRKTNAKQTGQPKKVAKNLEKDVKMSTRSTRRTRSNDVVEEEVEKEIEEEVEEEEAAEELEEDHAQQEQIVVIKIKKSKSTTVKEPVREPLSAAPLSAIAARRAAINAGLYKELVVEDNNDEEEEEEEEEDLENREGIEVQSVTDEEDLELREAMEHEEIVPISRTTTPNGGSTPMRPSTPMQQQSTKKNKIPAFLDYNSVSKFIPTAKNSCVINQEEDTYLFLGLKRGEDVVFMGQVLAAPLFGSISVSGAVISSGREMPVHNVVPKEDMLVSFYPVFSPRTHSLLRIASEPLDTPSIQSHYNPIEIDEHLIEAVFDELKNGRHEFETILVIKDLYGSGLENMRDAVSFTKNLIKLNRKEDNRDKELEINFLPGFYPILEPTPGVKAFKVENSWSSRTDSALANATSRASPLVSVVCGAKDMGKSSYSRYLINRLLAKYKRVAYLETDVGQSEFTPSGLLSLHYLTNPILGPPFTHQQLEPERSFFFGSASPRNNPGYYLECINELVDHWKQDQEKVRDDEEGEWIPLVVNTQGWVSGVGYNLLVSQIQKVEPTDIFSMRHHVFEYKNLPHTFNMDILPVQNEAFMVAKEAPTLHYLDCVLQDSNVVTLMDSFTSIQQRDITLGSYFHQAGMGDEHYLSPKWDYQQHMIERVPWVVDWRQSLNAIWVVYEEVKMNELFYALNGSLVGLIGDVIDFKGQNGPKNAVVLNNDTFTPPTYFNTQDQPAPAPHMTTCYGLGIVRAIDPSRHALLLLTPLPPSTLEKVSGLVKGEIQLPLWTMLDHKLEKGSGVANVPWKKVPYITQESTEGAGANALRVRRNLLRRSQQ